MKQELDFLKSSLSPGSTVIIACSGGPDSMCLLDLVTKLKKAYNLHIVVAHVNHKIRLESEEEAKMVENYCIKHEETFELLELNEYKKQKFTENEAREKRYAFFKTLVKKYNANYLLTAHHGDDLIETVLMRLTRGSNLSGYIGIKQVTNKDNYKILRPLLTTDKKSILAYLSANSIVYAHDKTNDELIHTRNRYRHIVLPFLKKENPLVHEKYLKFSEELSAYEEFVQNYIENKKLIVDNSILTNKLKDENDLIKRKCLELLIKGIQKDDYFDISDEQLKQLMKLYQKQNISINLNNHYIGYNSYGHIFIEKDINVSLKETIFDKDILINDLLFKYNIKEGDLSNACIYLNSEELKLPLKIRSFQAGDKIAVKNLNGTKKVSDIFINEKVPRHKRETYPLVVDSTDTIIWIPNLKKSKFAKDKSEKYDIIIKCEAR